MRSELHAISSGDKTNFGICMQHIPHVLTQRCLGHMQTSYQCPRMHVYAMFLYACIYQHALAALQVVKLIQCCYCCGRGQVHDAGGLLKAPSQRLLEECLIFASPLN